MELAKTVPAKKSASLDVEPIYTFRAHIGPVLSLAISSNGEQCFSGGIDATIQWWNMPSPNVDPYDTYEPNVLAGTLVAHTDAVWGLAYSGIKINYYLVQQMALLGYGIHKKNCHVFALTTETRNMEYLHQLTL